MQEIDDFFSDCAEVIWIDDVEDEDFGDACIIIYDVFSVIDLATIEVINNIPEWDVLIDAYEIEKSLREDDDFGSSYFRFKVNINYINNLVDRKKLTDMMSNLNIDIKNSEKLINSWRDGSELCSQK